MSNFPQPTIYLSHGGGPCFWIEFPPPLGPHAFNKLRLFLSGLLNSLPRPPDAFLVISAHWEEDTPTFGSASAPGMMFDYHGFPKHTYTLQYPAPGAPDLALRASALLAEAGLESRMDDQRGFDHGVFVPFLIIDPHARIPVLTLSLKRTLSASEHTDIGRALHALRHENVLIVGSGNSYHNLSGFFDGDAHDSKIFDTWLTQSVTDRDPRIRTARLSDWEKAPAARLCHPRSEHLIPLMVAAGAGGNDVGRQIFTDQIGGKTISCYAFG